MSSYSWLLLDVYTIIKHASAVFHLQILQTPLQRLVEELHSIHTIGAGKPLYMCYSKCKARCSWVWHARKALSLLGMQLTLISCVQGRRGCGCVGVGKGKWRQDLFSDCRLLELSNTVYYTPSKNASL